MIKLNLLQKDVNTILLALEDYETTKSIRGEKEQQEDASRIWNTIFDSVLAQKMEERKN